MIFYRAADGETVLLKTEVLYVLATFTASSFYLFSFVFPKGNFPSKSQVFTTALVNSIIIYLIFGTDLVIKGAEIGAQESENIIYWNYLYPLYVGYISIFFLLGLWNLFKKILRKKGVERLQILYVFWGYFLGSSLAMATNLLLPWLGNFSLNWFGQVASLFMVIFTVYAIIRHRLLGIKVIFSKILIYLILLIFIFTFYYLTISVKFLLFGDLQGIGPFLLGIPIGILFVFIFLRLLRYSQKLSDQIFFKGQNPQKIIKDLSVHFNSVIKIKNLVRVIIKEFEKILLAQDIRVIFVANGNSKKLASLENSGHLDIFIGEKESTRKATLDISNPLYQFLRDHPVSVLVRDELRDQDLIDVMDHHRAKVIVLLRVRKKIVGSILLGEKIDQGAYTQEDIEFLEIMSNQAAIAIENALLHQETVDFNKKLQQEVDRATAELKEANLQLKNSNVKIQKAYEQLQVLDKAKTDFLSIASHQLRTPLTSIKGFLSLVLEGSYGKISKKVREALEKSFLSSQRLNDLIENLLNISRIESGRISFDITQNDILSSIDKLISTLKVVAQSKGLKLVYHKPKKKIPPFNFDKVKIEEVISNLIDNAIKYTKEGQVEVSVEYHSRKKTIEVSVKDTGMGIQKDELDYIFEKFQRGKDTNSIYTEGIGLGLYFCQELAKAHKGKIEVSSPGVGKGSTFTLVLPTNLKEKRDKDFKTEEYIERAKKKS
jgi:signal transduction histidine kinase